jgi:DUF1707 SHOCT-like domain
MNDARTDRPSDVAQASVESAREKAVRRLSEHAIGGSMTLDEYAERAVSIERAATSEELKPRWWDCRKRPPACLRPVVAVGWSLCLVGRTSVAAGG